MKKHNFQKSLNENYKNWYNRQCEAQISFKVGFLAFLGYGLFIQQIYCLMNSSYISYLTLINLVNPLLSATNQTKIFYYHSDFDACRSFTRNLSSGHRITFIEWIFAQEKILLDLSLDVMFWLSFSINLTETVSLHGINNSVKTLLPLTLYLKLIAGALQIKFYNELRASSNQTISI